MEQVREPGGSLRCPWCFEGAAGDRWVTCERDATPIHADCLAEFAVCPICREAPSGSAAGEPSGTARRIVLRVLAGGGAPAAAAEPLEVEPLPVEVEAALRRLPVEYGARLRGWRVRALWSLATLLLAGLPWLQAPVVLVLSLLAYGVALRRASRPRAARWLASLPDPGRAELAERLAAQDREALATARRRRAAERELERARAELARLERGRPARYRDWLETRTPIEDAQRVRGVGPGITGSLRAAGVHTLRDLVRRPLPRIRGIGPARTALLAAWAAERGAALERLIATGGHFPGREELDRTLAMEAQPARRQAEAARQRARDARAALLAWLEARGSLRKRLQAPAREA